MPSISRVDQAVLLLQDRLRRLQERKGGKSASLAGSGKTGRSESLGPLRRMAEHRNVGDDDLRRALVRGLLENALGNELVSSLEFHSIADQVVQIIQNDPEGRELLARALSDLE